MVLLTSTGENSRSVLGEGIWSFLFRVPGRFITPGNQRARVLEVLVLLAVAAASAAIGLHEGREHSDIAFFHQNTFQPSVLLACGHGYGSAHPASGTAFADFLALDRDSLTCAEADIAAAPPSQTSPAHVSSMHLYLTMGLFWAAFGINWAAAPFVSALFAGLFGTGMYVLARQFTNVAVAIAVTLLAFSLDDLRAQIPHLRDFSKAPFMVLGLGLFFLQRRTRHALLRAAIAASAGAVVGLGYGFRPDVLLATLLIIVFGLSDIAVRHRQRRIELAAVTVMTAAAFALMAPVWAAKGERASNFPHFLALGLSQPFDDTLAIDQDLGYASALHYNDWFTYGVTLLHSRAQSSVAIPYASAQYDDAAIDYLIDYISLLPADIAQRTVHSMVLSVSKPFKIDAVGASIIILCGFVLGYWRYREAAIYLGLAAVGLGAAMVIQFHSRHYFYVGAITLVIFGMLLHSAAALAAGFVSRYRPGIFERPALTRHDLKPFETIALGILIALAAGLATLIGLREFQTARLSDHIEELNALPGKAVPVRRQEQAGRLHLIPLEPLFNPAKNPWRVSYFRIVFDEGCALHRPAAVVEYTFADAYFDYGFEIARLDATASVLYLPVLTSSRHQFEGLSLPIAATTCSVSFEAIDNHRLRRPLPLFFALGIEWRESALFERTVLEGRDLTALLLLEREKIFSSGPVYGGGGVLSVSAPLDRARYIELKINSLENISSDHANILDPRLVAEKRSLSVLALKPFRSVQEWGELKIGRTVTGGPLSVNGKTWGLGFGTHADATLIFEVPADFRMPAAEIELEFGIDDTTGGAGSVSLEIFAYR